MTPRIDSPGGSGAQVLGQSAVAVPHTGDVLEFAFATINLPANKMGPNGRVRITCLWSMTNNANAKTLRTRFGGIGGQVYQSIGAASVASYRHEGEIANRGALNSQVGSVSTGFGSSSTVVGTSAVDTSADTTLVITGQLGVNTDTLTLESYLVELFPG